MFNKILHQCFFHKNVQEVQFESVKTKRKPNGKVQRQLLATTTFVIAHTAIRM